MKYSNEFGLELYRRMVRIRKFEERVIRLVNENEIAGVTHEYIGQEAVAVGVCAALRHRDVITSTHRGHGHIIAKGGQTSKMMAELFGRTTGYNRGRGGSMHIADVTLGIYGANGMVGAGAPIAMGAAWAGQSRSDGTVAVSFFGDGAMNQGVIHETMNLASLWKLPLLFVCENNGFAVTMRSEHASANPRFAERAGAYAMQSEAVDGMNVREVFAAASRAAGAARTGEGPVFLECRTYRFMGHHTAEATMSLNYRHKEEVELWKERDPILLAARELTEAGVPMQQLKEVEREIALEIEEAVRYARNSPNPQPEESLEGMYATPYERLPAKGWVG